MALGHLQFLCAVVLSATVTSAASAQTETIPPEEPSDYDHALDAALEAHQRGDLDVAEQKMSQAHALRPSARTLRGLGVIAFAQEDYLKAAGYLQGALTNPIQPLSAHLKQSVEELLQRCRAHFTVYEFETDPKNATIRIERTEEAPITDGERVYWLSEGAHEVTIEADGFKPKHLRIQGKAGQVRAIHISLTPQPRATQQSTAFDFPEPPAPTSDSFPYRPVRWSLLGTGLATGIGSAVTGLVLLNRHGNLKNECADLGGCTDAEISSEFDRLKLNQLEVATWVLGATSVASFGAAALVYYFEKQNAPQPSVGLALGPCHVSLSYSY